MNRTWCERESDVVKALRRGSLSAELRSHVQGCAICRETQPVAQMLLETASLLRMEHEPPAAGLVWSRANARKREIALRRATRPLIFMQVLSGAYAVLFSAWLLHSFWHADSRQLMFGRSVLQAGTVYFSAVVAVLTIAIGAWYLLRDGRRSGEGVPT